jgi:signal transduction histidine kinase/DNA-binding response OmpR family regulator/HPt (histidine-containing phosphotransfer) domain-containing protein
MQAAIQKVPALLRAAKGHFQGARGAFGQHYAVLSEKVGAIRRADFAFSGKQHTMAAHHKALDDLMTDTAVRVGTLDDALRAMSKVVARELAVERVGFRLLNADRQSFSHDEVYDAREDQFHTLDYSRDRDFVHLMTKSFSRTVVSVNDIKESSELSPFYRDAQGNRHFTSAMLAQVIAHGDCVGVLTCSNRTAAKRWHEEDKLFASSICKLAALVVERLARENLEAQAAKSSELLRLQHHILKNVGRDDAFRTGPLAQALNALCEQATTYPNLTRASVYRCDPGSAVLRPLALVDVRTSAFDHLDTLAATDFMPSGRMDDMIEATVIHDLQSDPGISEFRRTYSQAHELRGAIDMPVKKDGHVVGVVCLRTSGAPRVWSPEEIMFASALATSASWAFARTDRQIAECLLAAAAERIVQQQSILGAISRDKKFRHENIHSAVAAINEYASTYPVIDRASVYVRDGATGMLVPFGIYDRRTQQHEPGTPIPTTFFAANGDLNMMTKCCVIPDLELAHDISAERRTYSENLGLRGAVDLPIEVDGEVVGVFCVRTCAKAHQWTSDEILFVTSLATMASLSIERHERQKVEIELRDANIAAQAGSKAKSHFLANMSHEIRTPMNGVLGMTDLLTETKLDERQRRLVSTISKSARTLLTIINDILDLSRIEEGKMSLDMHSFDLTACIEDAVALLAEGAQHKGVDLTLFVDDTATGMTQGDSVRLRQVLLNLIGNAVKFTSKGEVSVRVGTLLAQGAETRFKFEVQDQGIGIDAAALQNLFKPFSQADSTISRRFGGTGLGLSISRQLIAMMGGELLMTSEVGKGTCVTFELAMPHEPATELQDRSRKNLLADRRVLVVDDRATNREIVCSYLAASGAQAEPAENAIQAIELLQQAAQSGKPYALAIVDVVMPGIDGLELCRLIKGKPAIQSTQLVLLSSLSWSRDLGDVRDAGVQRLLHKPIRRQELTQVVASLLVGQAATPDAAADTASSAHTSATRLALHVLVAEDNQVNQAIAAAHLTNLGCIVTVVDNGLQAVAACERETFDVILMDCQMPEMDGLTATRTIREREQKNGQKPLPIIALTASAFEEDRRLCAAAGMNGYVCKPYSKSELVEVLKKWTGPVRVSTPLVNLTIETRTPIVDANAAPAPDTDDKQSIKTLRPALYAKLVGLYLEHSPTLLAGMQRTLRLGDFDGLRFAAHNLKASSANVEAMEIAGLCQQLELAAKESDQPSCASTVAEINAQLGRFAAVSRPSLSAASAKAS